jgi:hypothetical protein
MGEQWPRRPVGWTVAAHELDKGSPKEATTLSQLIRGLVASLAAKQTTGGTLPGRFTTLDCAFDGGFRRRTAKRDGARDWLHAVLGRMWRGGVPRLPTTGHRQSVCTSGGSVCCQWALNNTAAYPYKWYLAVRTSIGKARNLTTAKFA